MKLVGCMYHGEDDKVCIPCIIDDSCVVLSRGDDGKVEITCNESDEPKIKQWIACVDWSSGIVISGTIVDEVREDYALRCHRAVATEEFDWYNNLYEIVYYPGMLYLVAEGCIYAMVHSDSGRMVFCSADRYKNVWNNGIVYSNPLPSFGRQIMLYAVGNTVKYLEWTSPEEDMIESEHIVSPYADVSVLRNVYILSELGVWINK